MSRATFPHSTDVGEVRGKRILIRTPFDVPEQTVEGVPTLRISRGMRTVVSLARKGARVIILTHVGRDPKTSTAFLIPMLEHFIPVTYVNGVVGATAQKAVNEMQDGDVILLENLRSHSGEVTNDEEFIKELASLGEIYINDAFAVSHRAHASIVGLPALLPSFAGESFCEEYTELQKVMNPESPSLFIIGGAKFETKEPLIAEYVEHYSNVFVGGALANDFMKGRGCEVGMSMLSDVDLHGNVLLENEHILTPDVVVAVQNGVARNATCTTVLPSEKILDVGGDTIAILAPYIQNAKTILWNGPLGNFEAGYDAGTKACAKLIAESGAYSVVGGGDTVAAIEGLGLQDSFSFLSTAGGAMLAFLEHNTLPGIEALQK